MAQIQLPAPLASGRFLTRRQFAVKVRAAWTDDWQRIAYLEPLSATWTAAPTLSKATLRFRYGSIKREDSSLWTNFSRRKYLDSFVTIDALALDPDQEYPTQAWIGVILQESNRPLGTDASGGAAAGDLELTAMGLESLLEATAVRQAWVSNGAEPFQINWAPAFNDRYVRGESERGNRSASKYTLNGRQTYVFSDDGQIWTAQDIAEYLLAAYQPRGVAFQLTGQVEALAALKPVKLDQEGKRVLHLLDELIDRRRGLGFTIGYKDYEQLSSVGEVPLHVFTVFSETLQLDPEIPGNDQRLSIALAGRREIEELSLESDALARYGRVSFQGERVRVCFSASYRDNNLARGWSEDEETDYKTAGGGTALQRDQQRALDKYRPVFGYYLIRSDWDWYAGDGEGGQPRWNANPLVCPDGQLYPPDQPKIRNWGLRLLDRLPIRKPDDLAKASAEYLAPLAIAKDQVRDQWLQIDRHASPTHPHGSVRMLDNAFGAEVSTSPNHVLAYNHWDNSYLSQHPIHQANAFDWQKLIVTVCAETDSRAAATADIEGGREDLELVVRIPDVHLWYIVPNAVVAVAEGKLVRWQDLHADRADDIVRDDTSALRNAVELSRIWYGQERSAVSFVWADLLLGVPVGTYLESVSDAAQSQPAASVVSQVSFDFEGYTTAVQTSFGELAFGGW